MPGRSDIEAGKAFIRLYMKDSEVVKGLNWLGGKLQGIGTSVMKFGGLVSGLGASIVAPFVAAVATFTTVGDHLGKMSARTGIAASALAELGFAAEQGGASLDEVEKSVRKMQRTIVDAAGGSQTAVEALDRLGLSAASLRNLKPEDQFQRIADGLNGIEDPTVRAATAMEVFGKSGTLLLPMLGTLRQVRAEAQRRGLVPSDQAVKDAEAISDALNRVRRVGTAAAFEIGAALAPALLPALEVVAQIGTATVKWIKENGALVRTVAAIGAGLLAAGVIITATGAGIFGLGTVLGFVATGLAALAAALSSPLALVAAVGAALVAGVVYWARFTESGRASVQAIIGFFAPMVETLRTAIGAIGDALMGGDLVLAGQIAVKGLQLVFQQGLAQIASAIGGTLGDAIGSIGTDLIAGDLTSAWQTAIAGMAQLWADFAEGIVAVFTQAARLITAAWQSTVSGISDAILDASSKGGVLGKAASAVLGVDMQKEQGRANQLNAGLGLAPTDITKQAQADARQQIAGQAGFATDFLDRIDQSMREQSDAAGQAFRDRVAGGAAKAGDEAAQLEAELAALAGEAKRAKQAAAAGPGLATPELAVDGGSLGKTASFATFSAAALVAMGGGGGGVAQRTLEAVREQGKKQDKTNGLLAQLLAKPQPGMRP